MTPMQKPSRFDGLFYPSDPKVLKSMLEDFERGLEESVLEDEDSGNVIGIVSPHAGYVYSGRVAAHSFYAARRGRPETVVVIGLAHRVRLKGVSILQAQACSTPLGAIDCDRELAETLARRLAFASYQEPAHLSEHSVETQLPFVKRTFPEARVVEILTQDTTPPLPEDLGNAIAAVGRELGRNLLVVASTDLSHYPDSETARGLDLASLETLRQIDPIHCRESLQAVEARISPGISCAVCSKAAVFAGMRAVNELGAMGGRILAYANSGDAPQGDPSRVVGYGAVAWET